MIIDDRLKRLWDLDTARKRVEEATGRETVVYQFEFSSIKATISAIVQT